MATLTITKFHSLSEAIAEKVHNLGSDQIVVALSTVLPTTANTVLADITQVSYTNLSTRNVSRTSSTQTSGLYKLILVPLTLTASGAVAPFRYVTLFNDTATNDELIGFGDLGATTTLASGDSVVLTWDAVNGAISLT